MKFEGHILPNGDLEIEPVNDDTMGIVITVSFIIFCAIAGIFTIPDHGGSFVKYLFTNYMMYICILGVVMVNVLLFYADISVTDTGIIESLGSFFVYMYLGCKSYSLYGEWKNMSGLLEPICSFFGLIWMSLFFSIIFALICVGIAVLICHLGERSANKTIIVNKASKQVTVKEYMQMHTDQYANFRPRYEDKWKCSFCKEWTSMGQRYCEKCMQRRLDTDKVICVKTTR